MGELIGRETEKKQLSAYISSNRAEFIAIYGRRRVGKTFLVRQLLGEDLTFDLVGLINGTKSDELMAFTQALRQMTQQDNPAPKNWMEAFTMLRTALETSPKKKKCILFIDELPCFDTHLGGFVKAFDHFWNSWAAHQSNIKLIVCGSATSWMTKNLIDSHGGLHNRITHEMHIHPFTLAETETYLRKNSFKVSRQSILQLYMAVGGVPYYLSLLNKDLSIEQNIDQLFFGKDATLNKEFDRLFKSLYKSPKPYIDIIELLANTKEGLTRADIANKLGIKTGGYLTELLDDLTNCDFLRTFNSKRKKILNKELFYQLTDCFCIFHITHCQKATSNPHYWSDLSKKPTQNTWYGLAFERVCTLHIEEIKAALGINRISTEHYSWRSKEKNAQIDLIIDRADDMVNICEMKYSKGMYALQKEEYQKITNRMEVYREETNCKSGIYPTLITTNGLSDNEYSKEFQVVTLDDLFLSMGRQM